MHSPLISWSRMVFLAGIVLALVLIIPTAWFPFQLGKLALFALIITITSVLFVLGRGGPELLRAHGLRLALMVGILPLAYLLSTLVAGTGSLSVSGFGVEADTVLFTTVAFLAFIFSFDLFKTLRTVRMLATTIKWVLVGVVVFQSLVVLFGTSIIPFSIFSDRSLNLIGKWNDFGLLAGFLAVILLAQLDLARSSLVHRVVTAVGLVAIALLLGVVNFSLVWWFILVSAIVIGLTAFMTQRSEERVERQSNPYAYSSWAQKLPWFSVAGVVVSIIFLLYGSAINQDLSGRFPISSLEVRPSYSSTYSVISAAREGSVAQSIIGTGPNTFSSSWITHKPAEVNQSAFWNLDFNVGFSTLVTALGTVGLVGAVAWLIPFLLVLASVVRVIRLSLLSREERVPTVIVTLGSIFLFGAIVLYVPSLNVILLAFVLAGAAFGYLWRQGRHASTEEYVTSPLGVGGAWALVLVLLVVSLWGTWSIDRRFIAEAMTNQGAAALQVGNADGALAQAQSSRNVETTNDNLRLSVEGGMLKIQQIANDKNTSTADLQKQFTDAASSTIASALLLVQKYPDDYRAYVSLARVYDLLNSLKVQGAYQNAEQSYQKALEINPTAPDIALYLARLEAGQGKADLTQKYLSQSLTLKPNYTDAILLVVQLDVANNDIPNAIKAASAAAQTAPGVGPIWFELGLLYYASGDTKDAIAPLEQAIKIVPDYANAKYFLGLSYYAQSRPTDALAVFQDLAKSNPDSAEVKLILSNMQAGKQPFDSAVPPITNKPATRPTAPINQ